jgi:hypothetical protein
MLLGVCAEDEKQQLVRLKVAEHRPESNERILWSIHAVRKLRTDRLRKSGVEASLTGCVLIEDYGLTGKRENPEIVASPLPWPVKFQVIKQMGLWA